MVHRAIVKTGVDKAAIKLKVEVVITIVCVLVPI